MCTRYPRELFVLVHRACGEFVKSSKLHGRGIRYKYEEIRNISVPYNSMCLLYCRSGRNQADAGNLKYKQLALPSSIPDEIKQSANEAGETTTFNGTFRYNNSVYIYEFTNK